MCWTSSAERSKDGTCSLNKEVKKTIYRKNDRDKVMCVKNAEDIKNWY